MSDTDLTPTLLPPAAAAAASPPPSHPNQGGKTLEALARPRYKSWRKKYRKTRYHFDALLAENKRLFKDEQKLVAVAERLREEVDGLLEICLDFNQTPSLPPQLRFNIAYPTRRVSAAAALVDPDITPERADELVQSYCHAVQQGSIPPVDLRVVREQVEERLAAQGVESVEDVGRVVGEPVVPDGGDEDVEDAVAWLTAEQEDKFMDAVAWPGQVYTAPRPTQKKKEREAVAAATATSTTPAAPGGTTADKTPHWAELTPRELERQTELLNPQSQHNWLRTHARVATNIGGNVDDDDRDSVASHDVGGATNTNNNSSSGGHGKPASSRRKTAKDKNLAKQVGDRAVERAREGMSPSAYSGTATGTTTMTGGGDDDDVTMTGDDGTLGPGSSRKRIRDPDGAYRVKGGKAGGAAGKGKRKRSGEDLGSPGGGAGVGGTDGGSVKKARVEGE